MTFLLVLYGGYATGNGSVRAWVARLLEASILFPHLKAKGHNARNVAIK